MPTRPSVRPRLATRPKGQSFTETGSARRAASPARPAGGRKLTAKSKPFWETRPSRSTASSVKPPPTPARSGRRTCCRIAAFVGIALARSGVALLLVAVGELVRDVGRRIALRAELVRRLDTHAGDHGRLRGARARQRGHRVLQRPPLPVHAREQDERTHLLAHVVQRLVRRALQVVEQLREGGLRLVVLLELAVQLGELVAQHLWRRARTRAWWPLPPTRRRVRGAPARTCLDASFWNAVE